jgi:aspartate carbamoyltransferase regulatory subunit
LKVGFEVSVSSAQVKDVVRLLQLGMGEYEVVASSSGSRVRVKGKRLGDVEVIKLWILDPSSTIWSYSSGRKRRILPRVPKVLSGILNCPNQNCISSQPKEPAIPEFRVLKEKPLLLLCLYCGRYVRRENLQPENFKVERFIPPHKG